jgi:uncharacterized membrane protein YhaH (DUF805 family)
MQINICFGRLGRKQYIYGLAVYFLIILLPASFYAVSTAAPGATALAIQMSARGPIIIAQLFFVITMLGLSVRRLHDINMPVWLVALLVIPVVNVVLQVYLLITPSSPKRNQFGPAQQKHSLLEILGIWRLENDEQMND